MHHVIVIPGLSDNDFAFRRIVQPLWPRQGLQYHLFKANWRNRRTLAAKLLRLTDLIDTLAADGSRVSLVGMSAGASLAINALAARPKTLYKVINVCGRVRPGNSDAKPTLEDAARLSPTFAESVRQCELALRHMSMQMQSRVMSLRPLYDGVVPASTVEAPGGAVVRVLSVGHATSIGCAMVLYRGRMVQWLRS